MKFPRIVSPLIALALPACASPSFAGSYGVRLNARHCLALAPAQVSGLGPQWAALAAYVQRCGIAGADGRPALTVDIVRLDLANRDHFFNTRLDQKVPNPTLRDTSGRSLGELPEGFPVDPPGALRVTFADWRDGMPRRIDLFEAGQSAVSPHTLPSMRWDAAGRSFR